MPNRETIKNDMAAYNATCGIEKSSSFKILSIFSVDNERAAIKI